MKNLGTDDAALVAGAKPSVYKAEMEIAAKLMDWKAKWHPHGKGQAKGSIVEGLGLAFHTWGGGANQSSCTLRVYPDGGVETFCGTQDLGTGTRTVIALVLAETFGLPYEQIRLNIGSSKYAGQRTFGRQHHGRRRERIAPPGRAGRLRQDCRAGRQEAGGRSGDAGCRGRPRACRRHAR